MVNVCYSTWDEFRTITSKREVVCFGGGNWFKRLLSSHPEQYIKGVIDSYLSTEEMSILSYAGSTFKLYSLDEMAESISKDTIVLLTSLSYVDMIIALDKYEQFHDVDVYIYPLMEELYEEYELVKNDIQEKRNKRSNITINSRLKVYQIWEVIPRTQTAGGKAPRDVCRILEKRGINTIEVHRADEDNANGAEWVIQRARDDWSKVYEQIPEEAVLILQEPFREKLNYRNECLIRLKKNKSVKIISIIHDIERIRIMSSSSYMDKEYEFALQLADVMIVHNEVMKNYVEKHGGLGKCIISLEIFDYLYDGMIGDNIRQNEGVVYAGSLEERKCPFVYELNDISSINFQLYGPDYSEPNNSIDMGNVVYRGSFDADILPSVIRGGYGLIWDGDRLDTCAGGPGNYLKYNNPHKLSLYYVSGLPIVIWSQAAEALFVTENQTGIVIDSIYDLPNKLSNVTLEEYELMRSNATRIASRLRGGYYMNKAISNALKVLHVDDYI